MVFCPNKQKGCLYQTQRCNMEYHFLQNCLYTEFQCGGLKRQQQGEEEGKELTCKLPLEKRYIYAGRQEALQNLESAVDQDQPDGQQAKHTRTCPHALVECPNGCTETLAQYKLAEHTQHACLNIQDTCPVCASSMSRRDLPVHLSTCPDMVVPCPANEHGCVWVGKRRVLASDHVKSCRYVAVAPALEKQNNRISGVEQENKVIRQKLDRALALLNSFNASQQYNLSSTTPGSANTPVSQSAATDTVSPSLASHPSTATTTTTTSFTDSDFRQLFLEGDRFRDGIDQVRTQLTELDMRHSMSQLQESFRVGEEMASLRALVSSLRNQVHFLMTERRLGSLGLHQHGGHLQQAQTHLGMTQQQQQQQQYLQESPEREGSLTPPFTRLAAGAGPPRRLSDITRQDIKL